MIKLQMLSELHYFLKVAGATIRISSLTHLLSCYNLLEVSNLSAFLVVHIRLFNPSQKSLG